VPQHCALGPQKFYPLCLVLGLYLIKFLIYKKWLECFSPFARVEVRLKFPLPSATGVGYGPWGWSFVESNPQTAIPLRPALMRDTYVYQIGGDIIAHGARHHMQPYGLIPKAVNPLVPGIMPTRQGLKHLSRSTMSRSWLGAG